MAEALLGVEFDIHGGGVDLVFPHHENEAAQTLAARGEPLARIWMHNGMLELGAARRWPSPWATSAGCTRCSTPSAATCWSCSSAPATTGSRWRSPTSGWRTRGASAERIRDAGAAARAGRRVAGRRWPAYRDGFFAALRNDFNTAEALGSLYGWIREANRSEEPVGDAHLKEMLDVLGLIGLMAAEEAAPEEAWELAAGASSRARDKDWAEADRLRDELRAHGLGSPRRT